MSLFLSLPPFMYFYFCYSFPFAPPLLVYPSNPPDLVFISFFPSFLVFRSLVSSNIALLFCPFLQFHFFHHSCNVTLPFPPPFYPKPSFLSPFLSLLFTFSLPFPLSPVSNLPFNLSPSLFASITSLLPSAASIPPSGAEGGEDLSSVRVLAIK